MARRRPQGSIVRRGEGRFLLRWYESTDALTGKRVYASETFTGTATDAKARLRAILGSQDRGEYVSPTRETMAEYLERWLRDAKAQKLRARTLADYRDCIDRYVAPLDASKPGLGRVRLQALGVADVQRWIGALGERGLAPGTVRLAHRVLRSALSTAVRWQSVPRNVASGVELPGDSRRGIRALSAEEVARLRAELRGDPFALYFDVALHTGARPEELLGLAWSAVDFDRGTLRIERVLSRVRGSAAREVRASWTFEAPKTERGLRTVRLPAELAEALRTHKAAQAERAMKLGRRYARAHDLVFAADNGKPLAAGNLAARHLRPAVERAGLEGVTLYSLRHTSCSLGLASGEGVHVASARLGHAKAGFTLSVYAHPLEGEHEQASERRAELLFR